MKKGYAQLPVKKKHLPLSGQLCSFSLLKKKKKKKKTSDVMKLDERNISTTDKLSHLC